MTFSAVFRASPRRSFSRTLYIPVMVRSGCAACWRLRWESRDSPSWRMRCATAGVVLGNGNGRKQVVLVHVGSLPTPKCPRRQCPGLMNPGRENCQNGRIVGGDGVELVIRQYRSIQKDERLEL